MCSIPVVLCIHGKQLMQEREKLLSFVIVGGGPTGVEVAAEMYDMMTEDMKKLYPELMPFVKIRVIELMDYVLSAYDRKLGEYAANLFKRNGIELVCAAGHTVTVACWPQFQDVHQHMAVLYLCTSRACLLPM